MASRRSAGALAWIRAKSSSRTGWRVDGGGGGWVDAIVGFGHGRVPGVGYGDVSIVPGRAGRGTERTAAIAASTTSAARSYRPNCGTT